MAHSPALVANNASLFPAYFAKRPVLTHKNQLPSIKSRFQWVVLWSILQRLSLPQWKSTQAVVWSSRALSRPLAGQWPVAIIECFRTSFSNCVESGANEMFGTKWFDKKSEKHDEKFNENLRERARIHKRTHKRIRRRIYRNLARSTKNFLVRTSSQEDWECDSETSLGSCHTSSIEHIQTAWDRAILRLDDHRS